MNPLPASRPRPLGTMIAYGFPGLHVAGEFELAARIGASCLEILPDWSRPVDPITLRHLTIENGLEIHSVHGSWGMRRLRGAPVDLATIDPRSRRDSIDSVRYNLDWALTVGARFLVVHPGVLSDPEAQNERAACLQGSLSQLADHARGTEMTVCVENMPPGVYPGSSMSDLLNLVAEIDRPEVALALDTGHANMTTTAATETLGAAALLRTLHVHDNNGRTDAHLAPGQGSVDWPSWKSALDLVNYQGPIMLECIRQLRRHPEQIDDALLQLLHDLTLPPA